MNINKPSSMNLLPEDQEKIFTLFTTIPSGSTGKKLGYGIGLSTVKKIVEKNGGIITIESSPDKGTKFSFNIKKSWPLAKAVR